MPRTRYSVARAAAVGVIAAALALGAASPAMAFGPPDISFTPANGGEDPLVAQAIVCPGTSDTAQVTLTGTDGGAAASYGPTTRTLDVAGNFSGDYYFESFFDRDTDMTATVECFSGLVSMGTDTTIYHLPTTGASTSAPASLGVDQSLVVTGNCGTEVTIDSISVSAYREPADTLLAGYPTTIPFLNVTNYSVAIGTGNALAVPAGDSIAVYVTCHSSTPAVHNTSTRSSSTVMTAAVTAPPAAAGPALAATGVSATVPLLVGGSLLMAGAVLLLLRRRRAA